MILTKDFWLGEFTKSQIAARLGIRNNPTTQEIQNLKRLCQHVLQPLRDHLGLPVVITSGYRSPELNAKIGGAKNSQHTQGLAADIYVPGLSVQTVLTAIEAQGYPFDQLIDEYGSWVHVSVSRAAQPRRQVLRARVKGGWTVYTQI